MLENWVLPLTYLNSSKRVRIAAVPLKCHLTHLAILCFLGFYKTTGEHQKDSQATSVGLYRFQQKITGYNVLDFVVP